MGRLVVDAGVSPYSRSRDVGRLPKYRCIDLSTLFDGAVPICVFLQ